MPPRTKTSRLYYLAMLVLLLSILATMPGRGAQFHEGILPDDDIVSFEGIDPGEAVVEEHAPRLVGGLKALQTRLRYPKQARRMAVEGTVVLVFDVDVDGRVRNPSVLRSPGYGLGEEALRVLNEAEFRPARQNGRPVRVRCTLPVRFRLADGG